jgi:hypothetical protein
VNKEFDAGLSSESFTKKIRPDNAKSNASDFIQIPIIEKITPILFVLGREFDIVGAGCGCWRVRPRVLAVLVEPPLVCECGHRP